MSEKKLISGIAYGWWETGSEGVHWCVQENWEGEQWSYDDLWTIKNGDHLTIKDRLTGETVFEGLVKLDHKLCEVKTGAGYKAQAINGMYVHGVQATGCTPEEWFRWFMTKDGYLAEIRR